MLAYINRQLEGVPPVLYSEQAERRYQEIMGRMAKGRTPKNFIGGGGGANSQGGATFGGGHGASVATPTFGAGHGASVTINQGAAPTFGASVAISRMDSDVDDEGENAMMRYPMSRSDRNRAVPTYYFTDSGANGGANVGFPERTVLEGDDATRRDGKQDQMRRVMPGHPAGLMSNDGNEMKHDGMRMMRYEGMMDTAMMEQDMPDAMSEVRSQNVDLAYPHMEEDGDKMRKRFVKRESDSNEELPNAAAEAAEAEAAAAEGGAEGEAQVQAGSRGGGRRPQMLSSPVLVEETRTVPGGPRVFAAPLVVSVEEDEAREMGKVARVAKEMMRRVPPPPPPPPPSSIQDIIGFRGETEQVESTKVKRKHAVTTTRSRGQAKQQQQQQQQQKQQQQHQQQQHQQQQQDEEASSAQVEAAEQQHQDDRQRRRRRRGARRHLRPEPGV